MAKATRKRSPRKAAGLETTRDVFERVADLAYNLHWSWHPATQQLFATLDPALWRSTNHNPIKTLEDLPAIRRDTLNDDDEFVARLKRCEQDLQRYLAGPTWFGREHKGARKLQVAYFCSEYAIHESMPQYAGGLGVLAGDHLKTASDLGVPLVGIGLLYRHGYYTQSLTKTGLTRVVHPQHDYREWPLQDTGKTVVVPLARRRVHLKVWLLQVGRVPLYLLDADISRNHPDVRALTHRLYQGSPEQRLQQQVLLGIGGQRALEALGIEPTVYHLNEGHAAFCAVDRLRHHTMHGATYDEAVAAIRASTVFTTHTPVAAGHDYYEWKLVLKQLAPVVEGLGLDWQEFLALGRKDANDHEEHFCMTILALKLSARANGVSKLHGAVSREMWRALFDQPVNRVPIGHVTNGIHTPTWLAAEATPLYDRYLKPEFGREAEPSWPARATKIPAEELWALRNMLRAKLVRFIRARVEDQLQRRHATMKDLADAHEMFDEDTLTIGFARRFATYKRAPLIFKNLKRLKALLNDAKRPMQIVFAGKAHPADTGGRKFVQEVYKRTLAPGLKGRVALLEDYDMHIGRMLTSGCDVWLNNPVRPMEASGTSGMKPPLHGGLNLSIPDGWWAEGATRNNGFTIGDGTTFKSAAKQDRYDADLLYDLLENEVIPRFYRRDKAGVPRQWAKMMASALASVSGEFSGYRMLGDYVRDYYLPAAGIAKAPKRGGRKKKAGGRK